MYSDSLFSTHIYSTARSVLSKYCREMGWKHLQDIRLDIQDIYDTIIYPEYEFALYTSIALYNDGEEEIWGKTVIDDKVILIDNRLKKDDPEYTHTLAHEIGHALLHNQKDQTFEYRPDRSRGIYDPQLVNELHADCFMEHLLMPYELVEVGYQSIYSDRYFVYTGPGDYNLKDGPCYVESLDELVEKLAMTLSSFFPNISIEKLGIKLKQFGFIENKSSRGDRR